MQVSYRLVNLAEKNLPMLRAAFASTKEFMKMQPGNTRCVAQGYTEGIKLARASHALEVVA
jgi:hypothetical protein